MGKYFAAIMAICATQAMAAGDWRYLGTDNDKVNYFIEADTISTSYQGHPEIWLSRVKPGLHLWGEVEVQGKWVIDCKGRRGWVDEAISISASGEQRRDQRGSAVMSIQDGTTAGTLAMVACDQRLIQKLPRVDDRLKYKP